MELTESEGMGLVRLARDSVSSYLGKGQTIEPPVGAPEVFRKKARVFVTIHTLLPSQKEPIRQLRGCIGYLEARLSLGRATIRSAISAATADPRFPPMRSIELEEVVFEVNILDEPLRLRTTSRSDYPRSLTIGRDGLIVVNGGFRGILLPEVPIEWGWSPEEFLAQCCLKAGLYPDSWLDSETKVYRFQAEMYGELSPMGNIRRIELKPKVHLQ